MKQERTFKFSLGDSLVLGIFINAILFYCILEYNVPNFIGELCAYCFIFNLFLFTAWYIDRGDEKFKKEILEKSKRNETD